VLTFGVAYFLVFIAVYITIDAIPHDRESTMAGTCATPRSIIKRSELRRKEAKQRGKATSSGKRLDMLSDFKRIAE